MSEAIPHSVTLGIASLNPTYELVSAMRDVQPDDLSPKAALEKMYQQKKLL